MSAPRPRMLLTAAVVAATAATATPALAGGGYSLTAPTHAPRVGTRWVATVRGANGRVSLDVVFGGQVVGHLASGALRHGRFTDTVRWPSRAVGYPLVVRATVTGAGRPVRLDYAVKVRR